VYSGSEWSLPSSSPWHSRRASARSQVCVTRWSCIRCARWFYGACAAAFIAAAALVWGSPDLVALNIGIQVMTALLPLPLLPLVLGFLIALAMRGLPHDFRPSRAYLAVVQAVSALTCALGVFGALSGAGLV
jgi:hypothetical protein